jgi:hypothetical protein
MKISYLGGMRGYQTAIYRPGSGWTSRRGTVRFGRRPRAFHLDGLSFLAPITVARRRQPGLATRITIVASVITAAVLVGLSLGGVNLF